MRSETVVIFNTITGEIEGDCPHCGIWSGYTREDMATIRIPDQHSYKVLDAEEVKVIYLTDDRGYLHKIDALSGKLVRRESGTIELERERSPGVSNR